MECRLHHGLFDLFFELSLDIFHEDEVSESLLFFRYIRGIMSDEKSTIAIEKSRSHEKYHPCTDHDTEDDSHKRGRV